MKTLLLSLSTALSCALAVPSHAACTDAPIAVQVLGSGGPIADTARASSGYLIWMDGKTRVLIDAGGGVFVRYGESGAQVADLDLVAITHLHTDHVADLPAILKGATFSDRTRDLPISGPDGSASFPSLDQFLTLEFGAKAGAFRYLSSLLEGGNDAFQLKAVQVDAKLKQPTIVLDRPGLKVSAIGVPHGPVPALGYRVEAGGTRIVFSGDQNGSDPAFWKMAADADLLVMAHAVPEAADDTASHLHAKPSVIGAASAEAKVHHVVLSHLMGRSLAVLDQNLKLIRAAYAGPVDVAKDLACYPVKKR